ncbi:hypothetical protein J2S43_002934 [Catenuloplanes nepalensis]|uniref:DUF4132 domain-containing protein n=1 Tax=Catenuloplanes nepalensis TaxID=587533 RepID=A0ABT9MSL1_9ACTN|nr:DUF4132 domain-containing protein [Catenuloplanes nepalensis]MDP9794422.1 hypothetical protein [Catenuloplanes nepalensis]
MSSTAPAPRPDIPLPGMWSSPLPRRGDGTGFTPPDPDAPGALAALHAEHPGRRTECLAIAGTDPELAAADPDSPLGAAVTAHIQHEAGDHRFSAQLLAVLADAWLAAHGPVFAAEAAAALFGLRDVFDHRTPQGAPAAVAWRDEHGLADRYALQLRLATLYRVREALAVAPAEAYDEATTVLAGMLDRSVQVRVAATLMHPGEPDWAAPVIDQQTTAVYPDHTLGALLAACPGGVDRLADLKINLRAYLLDPGRRLLPTIIARGGAPEIITRLRDTDAPAFLVLLAYLPDDAAFVALRNRAAERELREPLRLAADLRPERAVRLFAEGAGRRLGEDLLRWHVTLHPDAAAAVAPTLTGDAATRVTALLDEIGTRTDATTVPDLTGDLPDKPPVIPDWMHDGVLPPLLRDGAGALPDAHVPALLTACALGRTAEVAAAFDPADFTRYAWDVFFRWYYLGGTAKENWTLGMLAALGDDDTIRRLTPTILAWPGEAGHARAVAGLDVLATIGTETALMALNRIAQRSTFKGLKNAARQKMDAVAAGLGLDGDQLADRLVPDVGLDPAGRLALDYGPRTFTVGFDETLTPYVTDAAGKRLKALPKPGAKDDPVAAPAAQKRFTELKKEVRGIAGDLVARLERDMINERRISGAELRAHYVTHPLVRHLAGRLVWGVYEDGRLTGAIRIAEDGSIAGAADETVTLDDDARVGVAHPIHLDEKLAAGFGEVFADYEILQPFPQLAREVYRLTDAEAGGRALARMAGRGAPDGRLIALERRGWLRDAPQDAGIINAIGRALPGGGQISAELDPGMSYYEPGGHQTLRRVELYGPVARLGELNPLLVSEVIRDLTIATADG